MLPAPLCGFQQILLAFHFACIHSLQKCVQTEMSSSANKSCRPAVAAGAGGPRAEEEEGRPLRE